MKVTARDKMRHYLNPLHVFCSLTYLLSKDKALKTARTYEKKVFKPFMSILL